MKKNLVKAIASSTLLVAVNTAFASDDITGVYVGGELQYNSYSLGSKANDAKNRLYAIYPSNILAPSKKSGALGVFLGYRLHDNLGFETGFASGATHKKSLTIRGGANTYQLNLKEHTSNMYLDLIGYLPVSAELDLLAAVGVGRLTSKVSGLETYNNVSTGQYNGRHSKIGPRAGLGAQYKLIDNFGVRFMGTYQKGNDWFKKAVGARFGLFYQF